MHKSEVVPVGEVENINVLADFFGCKVGCLPMTYLDLPLGASYMLTAIWNPTLEKFEIWLAGWRKILSF